MKTSTSLMLTDIMPHKRSWFTKVVKNKVFDTKSPDQVFASLKASGVQGIELLLPSYTRITQKDLQEVKTMLTENNMPVFSVHQTLRFFTKTKLQEIEELFELTQFLSAGVIVLHMNSAGKQVFDKHYIAAVHKLQKKYGIKVGFENREKFIGSLLRPYGWHAEKFSNLMQEDDFFITFDTTHLAHSGGDIITFFKHNKDRIVNIHLSDYKHHVLNSSLRPLRFKHLPLGKGELPIEDFLTVLHKENYKGLLTMEINTDLAGMCESARIISDYVSPQRKS